MRAEVRSTPPDLIIIDPLYAFVPSETDMFKANEIRALLWKISDIARETKSAIVAIRHLTKGKRDKAIYQGVGSIDVIGAARSAVLVAQDPENEERKIFAHLKRNLSGKGPSWAYELVIRSGRLPELVWSGKVDLNAEDLNGGPNDRPTALDSALSLLKHELAGRRRRATDMMSLAEEHGIAKRTLDRARKQLDVKAIKTEKGWYWSFSKDKPVK